MYTLKKQLNITRCECEVNINTLVLSHFLQIYMKKLDVDSPTCMEALALREHCTEVGDLFCRHHLHMYVCSERMNFIRNRSFLGHHLHIYVCSETFGCCKLTTNKTSQLTFSFPNKKLYADSLAYTEARHSVSTLRKLIDLFCHNIQMYVCSETLFVVILILIQKVTTCMFNKN